MADDKATQGKIIFIVAGIVLITGVGYVTSQQQTSPVFLGILAVALFLFSFVSVHLSLQLLILSMLLSPEFIVGQTAARDITIRLDDIMLGVVTASWFIRMAILKDIGFAISTPLNRPIIAYTFVALISTLLGILRGDVNLLSGAFFVIKYVEYFIFFIMIANYIRDFETINKMLSTMLLVLGAICVIGLFQIYSGEMVTTPFEGESGERNTLGGYLALMGGVAGGVLLYTDSTAEKSVLGVMLSVLAVVLLFSISRSGWVGTFAVGLVLFIYAPKKYLFGPIFLGIIILIIFFSPDVTKDRFLYTFSDEAARFNRNITFLGVTLDPSSSARLFSYQLILSQIREHIFLGYGVTGFPFTDSQFFRTLSEMGFIGLGILLWLFRKIYKLIKEAISLKAPPRIHGMLVGLMAGYFGILIHSLTANTFIIVRIAEPFWCLMGMTIVTINLTKSEEIPQT